MRNACHTQASANNVELFISTINPNNVGICILEFRAGKKQSGFPKLNFVAEIFLGTLFAKSNTK